MNIGILPYLLVFCLIKALRGCPLFLCDPSVMFVETMLSCVRKSKEETAYL